MIEVVGRSSAPCGLPARGVEENGLHVTRPPVAARERPSGAKATHCPLVSHWCHRPGHSGQSTLGQVEKVDRIRSARVGQGRALRGDRHRLDPVFVSRAVVSPALGPPPSGRGVPPHKRAVAGRGDHVAAVGREQGGDGGTRQAIQDRQYAAIRRGPDPHRGVVARRDQPGAAGIEADPVDLVFMPAEDEPLLPRIRIPDPGGSVLRPPWRRYDRPGRIRRGMRPFLRARPSSCARRP